MRSYSPEEKIINEIKKKKKLGFCTSFEFMKTERRCMRFF